MKIFLEYIDLVLAKKISSRIRSNDEESWKMACEKCEGIKNNKAKPMV